MWFFTQIFFESTVIYEGFDQIFRIWSLHDSKIYSQTNLNPHEYPNFLRFFDRTEIYDTFPAILDHPRGYSLFSLEMACK